MSGYDDNNDGGMQFYAEHQARQEIEADAEYHAWLDKINSEFRLIGAGQTDQFKGA